MTLTTNAKWAIAVAILVIGFISFAGVQSHMITKYQQVAAAALQKASDDAVRVVVADKERDAAKATADTWKGQAVAALAKVTALQAKIAGLKPQAPAAGPAPREAQPLADDYTAQGFPPVEVGPVMGWSLDNASLMLPLVMDGKNYPSALERINLMGQEEVALNTALDDQTKRADSLDTALASAKQGEAACQDEVTDLKTAVKAKDKIIGAEKRSKGVWGAVGFALGFLAKWAIVAL